MGTATHRKKHVKPAADVTDAKDRICLRCDKTFQSNNRGNRICPQCRKLRG